MLTFNDFISTIRTDRLRQIRDKKNQKLIINDSRRYRYIDEIYLKNNKKDYSFGVQVSFREIFFYIKDGGSNCYYNIEDLYNLLRLMTKSSRTRKKYVLTNLDKLIGSCSDNSIEKIEGENYFVYQGIEYYFDNPLIKDNGATVSLSEGDPLISYAKVFVLLNLIQKKSNSFFENGNTDYINGLVRMLRVLLDLKHDNPTLIKKGWKYIRADKKFVFNYIYNEDKDDKYDKYYLTEEEYNDIMGGKES